MPHKPGDRIKVRWGLDIAEGVVTRVSGDRITSTSTSRERTSPSAPSSAKVISSTLEGKRTWPRRVRR